jgi:glycosyltransferase involved in cell wall biosynthesis
VTNSLKILIIGNDASLLKESSSVRSRLEHYGTYVKSIDVLLFINHKEDSNLLNQSRPIMAKNNLTIYPILVSNKFFASILCLGKIRKSFRDISVISVQDPFEMGLLGLIASIIISKPLHLQVHIDYFSPHFKRESLRQFFQSLIANSIIRRASEVRVVSKKISSYLIEKVKIPSSKISVVPVFVDTDDISKIPISMDAHSLFSGDTSIVLMASRLVRQKNILLGIEAFILAQRRFPQLRLLIVGSGTEEKKIHRFILDQKADENIKTLPWSDNLISLIKSSDIFMITSDYEGWGMTIIEAAASGKPIIMTNVGCAGEFLIDKKNGIVVPVRDLDAITSAICLLSTDQHFAMNLASNAKASALALRGEENDRNIIGSWSKSVKTII